MNAPERSVLRWLEGPAADPAEFQPALLRLQEQPPAPLARAVLIGLLALLAALLVWAALGRLDVVAVAEGKLVPQSYLKIVQPAEAGIVKQILVQEGQAVTAGQVLMRMDAALSESDGKTLSNDHALKRLSLRRIDAQLAGTGFAREARDPGELYAQVAAQYQANRLAFEAAITQEKSVLEKARHDLAAAQEIRQKLLQVLPHYQEQEQAYARLARDGFVGKILSTDKVRERIEKEQDLKAQEYAIAGSRDTIAQSEHRIAQINAEYRKQLQTERVEVAAQLERLTQELAKQQHRHGLLELKAPQGGLVKDLATHTAGTVVSPGTVLMTLVPQDEALHAEVWVSNQDVGFVRASQPVKLKLQTFQFQKYGMLDGSVQQVSADASDAPGKVPAESGEQPSAGSLVYRTLVALGDQHLSADGERYALSPGMQVQAEIKLGTRTVLEYLLSPVTKAFHEAGRER
jgi:HlyD family secretion protein